MIGLLSGIGQTVLIFGAAYGLSRFLIKERILSRPEYFIIRIVLGLGIISCLTLIVSFLHMIGFYWWLALILIGNSIAAFEFLTQKTNWKKGKITLWMAFFFIFVGVNFFYSLFPPTFYDSMLYHLAVPNYYILNGGIVPWPSNFLSHLPLNVEMLFLFSLLGKSYFVPKLISFSSGIFIIVLLYQWGKEIQGKTGLWASLLIYTIPQFGFLATSAKSDIPAFLFLLASVRLLFYYIDRNQKRILILSSFLAGMAVTAKYTLSFYLLALAVSLFMGLKKPLKQKLTVLLVVSVIVFICLMPWLIKNYVFTGNPVYPYLNGLFKVQELDQVQWADFAKSIKRGEKNTLKEYLLFPAHLFLFPYRYGLTSVWGVAFLCFLPSLLLIKRRLEFQSLIMTACLGFMMLMFFSRIPRYFLPSLIFLSIPMAFGLDRLFLIKPLLKKWISLLFVILTLVNLVLLVDLQERFSKSFAYIRKKVTGQFKGQNIKYLYALPYYRAAEYINSHLQDKDRVILVGEERTFYLQKSFIASTFNDKNLLLSLFQQSASYGEFVSLLKREGITHVLYSPSGLMRMVKNSSIYQLTDVNRQHLETYLSQMIQVYSDRIYVLYQVPSFP